MILLLRSQNFPKYTLFIRSAPRYYVCPALTPSAASRIQVPLNDLDLSHVSILYTQGEMAAITPIYDYDFQILQASLPASEGTWRQLLYWLGPPGLVLALVVSTTLDEPRFKLQGLPGCPAVGKVLEASPAS